MTNKVTVPRAQGIKCPYTGDDLEVYLTVVAGGVLYSCPNAFTVAEPVDSLGELQDRASMRNGIRGVVDGVQKPVCAYTGERLFLRILPDGRYVYTGGFNPRRAFTDLDELLYYLTMRHGKAMRMKPTGLQPVERVRENPPERPDAVIKPSDATLEAMEKVASEHMERGTTVSLSVGAPGKGKSGGRR